MAGGTPRGGAQDRPWELGVSSAPHFHTAGASRRGFGGCHREVLGWRTISTNAYSLGLAQGTPAVTGRGCPLAWRLVTGHPHPAGPCVLVPSTLRPDTTPHPKPGHCPRTRSAANPTAFAATTPLVAPDP